MFARRIARRIALVVLVLNMAGSAYGQPADSGGPDIPTVDTLVPGNSEPTFTLNAPPNSVGTRYFKYHFFGSGYTWEPSPVIPDSPGSATGRTQLIEGLSGGAVAIVFKTTGMAMTGSAGSSTQYVDFIFCSVPLNEVCETTPRRYRFVVDPLLSTTTGTITTDTTTPVTIKLESRFPTVNAAISATCAQRNGATITVSPASRTTDFNGEAAFTITTSNLRLIAPSGPAPEGECVFRTVAGSQMKQIDVRGTRIAPSITASPTLVSVANAGTTAIDQAVEVSTSGPATPGALIDVSCTASAGGGVTVNNGPPSTSALTGSDGKVTFQIKATNLVALVPAAPPLIECNFNLRNFSIGAQYKAVGKQINPTLALSTSLIAQPGVSTLTATMSPAYPGFTIGATCPTNNLPPVSATATTAPTNVQGRQTFSVSAAQLVIVNPNVSLLPSVSCTFKVTGANNSAVLNFSTGNVCAFTPGVSSPRPAQCGDPVN